MLKLEVVTVGDRQMVKVVETGGRVWWIDPFESTEKGEEGKENTYMMTVHHAPPFWGDDGVDVFVVPSGRPRVYGG